MAKKIPDIVPSVPGDHETRLPEDLNEVIDDPLAVIEVLKSAILRQDVDRAEVAQALKQVLYQYETQYRVFRVAAAGVEISRVTRLLTFLTSCEEVLMSKDRLENASTKDLLRMYALAQSNLVAGLDTIKQVADMRIDMIAKTGVASTPEAIFNAGQGGELDTLSDLPGLDSQGRDKVRKLLDSVVTAIHSDKSVYEEDDTDEDE